MNKLIPVESMTGIMFLYTIFFILMVVVNCLLSYKLFLFIKNNKKITIDNNNLIKNNIFLNNEKSNLTNKIDQLIVVNAILNRQPKETLKENEKKQKQNADIKKNVSAEDFVKFHQNNCFVIYMSDSIKIKNIIEETKVQIPLFDTKINFLNHPQENEKFLSLSAVVLN